jgi:hypothetical protein
MSKSRVGLLALAVIALAAPGQVSAAPSPTRTVLSAFSFAPAAPFVGQTVTFTSGAAASGQNNALVLQDWDLDNDGEFDDGTGATVRRAFAPAGSYVVRHRAVDKFYNEAIAVQTVTVVNPPDTPLLAPFPVVQMAGRVTRKGTRVRLSVIAPDGASITVRCRGRGCPLRRQTRTARVGPVTFGAGTRVIRLRRLERHTLRRGAIVKIIVTKPGTIGKYASFKMRRGKPPRRTDACVFAGTSVPISCPSS